MTDTQQTEKPAKGWQPGISGNPAGRPPGKSEAAKLREAIGEAKILAIWKKIAEQAETGDAVSARLILDRVSPTIKPVEHCAPFPLSGETLSEQGKSVMQAVAAGELSPSQGAQLVTALGALARVIETDELARRIEALEAKNAGKA